MLIDIVEVFAADSLPTDPLSRQSVSKIMNMVVFRFTETCRPRLCEAVSLNRALHDSEAMIRLIAAATEKRLLLEYGAVAEILASYDIFGLLTEALSLCCRAAQSCSASLETALATCMDNLAQTDTIISKFSSFLLLESVVLVPLESGSSEIGIWRRCAMIALHQLSLHGAALTSDQVFSLHAQGVVKFMINHFESSHKWLDCLVDIFRVRNRLY